MALIQDLRPGKRDVRGPHQPVPAEYIVFSGVGGEKYLQINTFGSSHRQVKGIASQTIQFDQASARQLAKVLLDMLK